MITPEHTKFVAGHMTRAQKIVVGAWGSGAHETSHPRDNKHFDAPGEREHGEAEAGDRQSHGFQPTGPMGCCAYVPTVFGVGFL